MAVENSSRELHEHVKEQNLKDPNWKSPFERDETRVSVSGQGATFSPGGIYRLACLIDYCRFTMERPPETWKKEEKLKRHKRRAYEHDSCAEWELWITILSDSRTPTAPARYPRTAQAGDPRSNTYPHPQPTVPRPSKTSSFDWHPPPPRERQPTRSQQPNRASPSQYNYPVQNPDQGPRRPSTRGTSGSDNRHGLQNGVQQRPSVQKKKRKSRPWCCFC